MECVVANLSTAVKRGTYDGRQYAIVPVTMIVSGVLAGSKGPLYYPTSELRKDPSVWNGMPVVVYHPMRSGVNVSARDPGVLESQGIGTVFGAKVDKTGRLKAEAWIDIEKAKKVDKRVFDALTSGTRMEISTGLFTDQDPANPGATFNGKPYTHIARNHRPDHLAILPDQVGACSLQDGCGMLVNERALTVDEAIAIVNGFNDAGQLTVNCAGTDCNCGCTTENEKSDELDMTPEKACEIMRDGAVHGHELTEAQRGMFGALCGQRDK